MFASFMLLYSSTTAWSYAGDYKISEDIETDLFYIPGFTLVTIAGSIMKHVGVGRVKMGLVRVITGHKVGYFLFSYFSFICCNFQT